MDTAQITRDLRARIAGREWALGQRIDSFRRLQERYDINGVSGVQNILAPLITEGILEGRQGRGTYLLRWPDPASEQVPTPTARSAARSHLDEALAHLTHLRRSLRRASDHLARLDDLDAATPEERIRVRVHDVDGRWAIQGAADPWWTVRQHGDDQPPALVADDWFGPGWHEVLTLRVQPAS